MITPKLKADELVFFFVGQPLMIDYFREFIQNPQKKSKWSFDDKLVKRKLFIYLFSIIRVPSICPFFLLFSSTDYQHTGWIDIPIHDYSWNNGHKSCHVEIIN